jgi:hypothetical protein
VHEVLTHVVDAAHAACAAVSSELLGQGGEGATEGAGSETGTQSQSQSA